MPGLIQDLISGAGWKQTLGDVATNLHNAYSPQGQMQQGQGQGQASPNASLIDPRNPNSPFFKRRTPRTPSIDPMTGGYNTSIGDTSGGAVNAYGGGSAEDNYSGY